MGKTARRSVASDPLSPPYESTTSATQTTKQRTDPSFYSTANTYIRRPIKSSATSYRPSKYGNRSQGTTPYLRPTVESRFYELNETAVAIARQRERLEFFATYDVMTGVRIAATLGAFFGLMVFLIVYKSRSTSNKALQKCLEDPKIAAVAAAVMQEEEDRELQEAFEATAFSLCKDDLDFPIEDHEIIRERMLSLGNVSAPPVLHRNFRFSSISGYSSLIEPHRRFSYNEKFRRQSTSESQSSRILSAYRMGDSFGTDDYFIESDGEEADDEFEQFTTTADIAQQSNLLAVPGKGGSESRRSSGITCCSTESSFLERRCSAVTLGLSSLASVSQNPSRRTSQDTALLQHLNRPGIQVTEPTPKTSPCPSERQRDPFSYSTTNHSKSRHCDNSIVSDYDSFDNSRSENFLISNSHLEHTTPHVAHTNSARNSRQCNEKLLRRAPLASLSSFKMSSTDYQDSDLRSLGSDSVFAESFADTDDDMEQFSTDSDELSLTTSPTPTTATSTLAHQTSQTHKQLLYQQRMGVNSASFVIHIDDDDDGADDGEVRPQSRTKDEHSEKYNLMTGRTMNKSLHYSYDTDNSVVDKPNVICGGCRPKIKTSCPASQMSSHPHTHAVTLLERQQTYSTTSNSTSPPTTRPASHSYAGRLSTTPATPHPVCSSSNVELSLDTPFFRADEKDDNSIKKECVEVNVIVKTNSFSGNNVSPSVILELPIITTTKADDDGDEATKSREDSVGHMDDPSIPGPSHRKWSKETLF